MRTIQGNPITYLLTGLLIALIPGCVEEFTPDTANEIADILVVEGTISEGENTTIKLSRSVGLSKETTANPVSGANIYVESSDGWTSLPATELFAGEYRIQIDELNADATYSLVINTGGKTYQSIPSQPLATPEIDSVSWKIKAEGEPVTIHVTTHDTQRSVGYYRWSYTEDWEIHASYFANADYDINQNIYTPYSLDGYNTYYCWNSDRSREFLLGNTEKISGNLIYEKKLLSIPTDDKRLSYLYSILVRQWSISKKAYDYQFNLQNNINEAGSIFAPQPSELRGNIICLTEPDEPVIGYIDIATIAEKRIFISEKEVEGAGHRYTPCVTVNAGSVSAAIDSMMSMGLVILFSPFDLSQPAPPGMVEISLTEKRCVDCLLWGNKNKPHFWPNDHQ